MERPRAFVVLALAWIVSAWLPLRAGEDGPTVLEKGFYSYQAPAGWKVSVADFPESPASSCAGPVQKGFAPHIEVFIRNSPQKLLPDYVAAYMDSLQTDRDGDFKVIHHAPFATAAGLDGIRVVAATTVEKRRLEQTLYFFDVGSGKVLIVTASCLAADDARWAPVFDASIKTLTLE